MSVPSRLNSGMPRKAHQPATKIVAPVERMAPWMSGGMSWMASFTATWLKPQDKHNINTNAVGDRVERAGDVMVGGGTGGHGIPGGEAGVLTQAAGRSYAPGRKAVTAGGWALSRLLAMGADAGNLDYRRLRREAGGARGASDGVGDRGGGRLAHRAAFLADEEHHRIAGLS